MIKQLREFIKDKPVAFWLLTSAFAFLSLVLTLCFVDSQIEHYVEYQKVQAIKQVGTNATLNLNIGPALGN